jgi:DNA-directed RNA polymerase specialized sigma24 family protein
MGIGRGSLLGSEVMDKDSKVELSPVEIRAAVTAVLRSLRQRFPEAQEDIIEDVTCEAFRQVMERCGDSLKAPSLKALLEQQAVWNLQHIWREEKKLARDVDSDALPSPSNHEEAYMARRVISVISKSNTLTRRTKAILKLYGLGYKLKEIAMKMHLKIETIRKKRQRGVKKLKEEMMSKEEEVPE